MSRELRRRTVSCPLCGQPWGESYYRLFHMRDTHYECNCGKWFVNLGAHVAQMKRWHSTDEPHHAVGRPEKPGAIEEPVREERPRTYVGTDGREHENGDVE